MLALSLPPSSSSGELASITGICLFVCSYIRDWRNITLLCLPYCLFFLVSSVLNNGLCVVFTVLLDIVRRCKTDD